ncbi:endonuclease/exonuclease/phosphatase family protein [Poriferisphaera corsica]|nr:endonuclease/exonuclease/phosphatase family protein [Poriferisphaera corsica]
MKVAVIALVTMLGLQVTLFAQTDTLRVVNYNVLHGPSGSQEINDFSNIMQAIGSQNYNGITRAVDVLSLQETSNSSITAARNALNSVYGSGTYGSYITPQGKSGLWNGVIYNTQTLNLLSSTQITSSQLTRNVARVHFDPINSVSNDDFYLYSMHLKAGNSSSDRSRRNDEVNVIRSNADALGSDANVIFSGDFNVYRSSEAAYQRFLSSGNAKANDPINRPGNWHDNNSFSDIHTQDPSNTMDDRFDFQLLTDEFFDGEGIDYIQDSYRAFGNIDSHTFNNTILTGYSPSHPFYDVAESLFNFSDHLPVIADYSIEIPEPGTMLALLLPSIGLVIRRQRI